jgi:hypothetical protein
VIFLSRGFHNGPVERANALPGIFVVYSIVKDQTQQWRQRRTYGIWPQMQAKKKALAVFSIQMFVICQYALQ